MDHLQKRSKRSNSRRKKIWISGKTLYKISYSYDPDGNLASTTRYIHGKKAVESTLYDPFGREIEHKDALGFATRTTFNENFTNSLGQKVLQTSSIDPRGITTIKTQDALFRTVKTEIENLQKDTISSREMFHDPQGNLLFQKDHIYEDGRFKETQTFKYTYTSNHQIESFTRGFGTQKKEPQVLPISPQEKEPQKPIPME